MGKRRAQQGPPTELEMREGNVDVPEESLVENTPEEKPFFDRAGVEDGYQNYLDSLKEQDGEPVQQEAQKETPQDEVKQEVSAQPPVQEEEVRQETSPPVQESKEVKPSSRFKDLTEAEAEVAKIEERRANHEKKMHEATQEAAELKRQLKFIVETLQSSKTVPESTPKVEEVPKTILDLPREELAQAILERPDEVISALEERAEQRAVQKAIKTIEERVQEGTKVQTAKILKEKVDQTAIHFKEKYPELLPLQKVVGIYGDELMGTQEGYRLLMQDPVKFIDKAVENTRIALNSGKPILESGNGGEPKAEATEKPVPPVVVQGEKREKLIASPVVKPGVGGPSAPVEEQEITPAQYIEERQKIFDQFRTGR
jgi:cell pole-organizing protein PopZ